MVIFHSFLYVYQRVSAKSPRIRGFTPPAPWTPREVAAGTLRVPPGGRSAIQMTTMEYVVFVLGKNKCWLYILFGMYNYWKIVSQI